MLIKLKLICNNWNYVCTREWEKIYITQNEYCTRIILKFIIFDSLSSSIKIGWEFIPHSIILWGQSNNGCNMIIISVSTSIPFYPLDSWILQQFHNFVKDFTKNLFIAQISSWILDSSKYTSFFSFRLQVELWRIIYKSWYRLHIRLIYFPV